MRRTWSSEEQPSNKQSGIFCRNSSVCSCFRADSCKRPGAAGALRRHLADPLPGGSRRPDIFDQCFFCAEAMLMQNGMCRWTRSWRFLDLLPAVLSARCAACKKHVVEVIGQQSDLCQLTRSQLPGRKDVSPRSPVGYSVTPNNSKHVSHASQGSACSDHAWAPPCGKPGQVSAVR